MMKQGVDHGFPLGFEKQAASGNNKRKSRSNEDSRKQAILENQVEQLHREIEDIEEIYTDLRGLKHDMRSHLNNIMQYVKGVGNGDTREIDEYIGQIEDAVNRLDFSSKSGNPITDIIICQRQQEARKQEILQRFFHQTKCNNNCFYFESSPNDQLFLDF